MKPISGTEAAHRIGIKNNQAFVELFVKTGQIKPIKFPGRKRSSYKPEEVDELLDKNKKTIKAGDFNTKLALEILNK